jgi:hypothetical protein
MTTQELKNRTFEFGVRAISAVEALPKTETARILGRHESAYWMEVIVARKLLRRAQLKSLLAEANELFAITVASIKTGRRRHRA